MSFGEYAQELIATANYITQDGKGILASDESTGKRFSFFFSLEISLSTSHLLCVCVSCTCVSLRVGLEFYSVCVV